MKKTIIANWKMNPSDAKSVVRYFAALGRARQILKYADVVIAPPFPYLALAPRSALYALGAQDLFWEKEGAYTGEVSASMLKACGVRYVIVGHSERRKLGETDEIAAKKVRRALDAKLTPVLCIGESRRDADGAFFSVIRSQLEKSLSLARSSDIGKILFAYEPVWAVGAGHKPATARDAQEAALFIKKTVASRFGTARARAVRVIYGGSVAPANAAAFLREHDVAGFLVGRESLDPKAFLAIVQCVRIAS